MCFHHALLQGQCPTVPTSWPLSYDFPSFPHDSSSAVLHGPSPKVSCLQPLPQCASITTLLQGQCPIVPTSWPLSYDFPSFPHGSSPLSFQDPPQLYLPSAPPPPHHCHSFMTSPMSFPHDSSPISLLSWSPPLSLPHDLTQCPSL